MSYRCDPAAVKVADFLGYHCNGANPVVTFRNPFGLANWTMPFLELLIVGGAVFAFVHAWRRWKRDGDPINIALWGASLVYLALVEPPLYFPSWFGLDKYVGFIFSHNVFTVQFMYDRLPLYIVAFYTVITQLTYELIRALGIFQRRGAAVGAIATAFACQVFYETFDQLGPQLKWWAWNTENKVNQPALASVPMNSMWVFASVSFGFLTWLVVRLVGQDERGDARSRLQIVLRTLLAGAFTPLFMVVGAAPTRVSGDAHSDSLQTVLVSVLLALLWIVGSVLVAEACLRIQRTDPVSSPAFVRIYPGLYVGVMVVFWVSALPDFFDAKNGITPSGTPIGSGWYSLACIVASAGLVMAARRAARPLPTVGATQVMGAFDDGKPRLGRASTSNG